MTGALASRADRPRIASDLLCPHLVQTARSWNVCAKLLACNLPVATPTTPELPPAEAAGPVSSAFISCCPTM